MKIFFKSKVGRLAELVLLISLMIITFSNIKVLATDYEQMKNSTVVYSGDNKELFSIELDTSLNRLVLYAVYNSDPTIIQSYHTKGFYFSSVKSTGGNTLAISESKRKYVDLSKTLEDGVKQHEYYTNSTTSFDTYRFTAKQVIDALHYLFPGEDLTEPHKIYLHDVFVKKRRNSVTSNEWIYDYSGKTYDTLDEFLTMYPYYIGNNAKREEMSPYYNIPITIALKGVKVKILCVDEEGKTLKDLGTEKVVMGDDFKYTVKDTTITIGKNEHAKNYVYEKYNYDTATSTETSITVDNVEKDGTLKLVYKLSSPPPGTPTPTPTPSDSPEIEETMSQAATGPVSSLTIKSDERGNEHFDVLDGIPTTDSLYANVLTNRYLVDYTFQNMSGKKVYNVSVTRNYIFLNKIPYSYTYYDGGRWVTRTSYRTERTYGSQTKTYAIERKYSYWEVAGMNVYTPASARANNYSLPSGGIDINAVGLLIPSTVIQTPSAHIIEPKFQNVTLPTRTLSGTYTCPNENWYSNANKAVGEIICINDYLSFDGNVYMSSTPQKTKAPTPSKVPTMGDIVSNNVFYKSHQLIDYNKLNGTFESSGTVKYIPSYTYGIKTKQLDQNYAITSTNSVTIHTPVVCNAILKDSKEFNQMINPSNKASLVLDRYFSVNIPTVGQHLDYLGYGYNNYSRYTFTRQVKFPFDVYRDNTFIPKNTWYDISGETTFYLPTWVNEGFYTIDFRAVALNADMNNLDNQSQTNANTSIIKYVATDTIDVEVSGRVYGFSVYDITDYPTWESVFRKSNSLLLTNNVYSVGLRNRNGVLVKNNPLYTLPIMQGSHPVNKVQALGTGYLFRYYLYTIGNMYDDSDAIHITPTFYYISADGKNRTEVDVYYTESFNNQVNELVKVGSDRDKLNKKTMSLGNSYTSVPAEELKVTAELMNTTVNNLKASNTEAYTFANIVLNYKLRTFVGTSLNIPALVDKNIAQKSVQKWYGEYYLPSNVHIAKKGYEVEAYAKKNGVDYKEDFWLDMEGGYILINMEVTTIDDNKTHLSYYGSGRPGTCNMWKLEGFTAVKQNSDKISYNLTQGDVILYNISKSAVNDYKVGGTH